MRGRGAAARALRWGAGALAAAGVAAAAGAVWAWTSLGRPYRGFPGENKVVRISPGADARRILEGLEAHGILPDALLARAYLVYALGDPSLKAGEYRFVGASSPRAVLDKLVRGEVVTHLVTIVEGLTLDETARHLAVGGFGDYGALRRAMASPDEIADLDPGAETLEGYLFPDTYHFARGTTEPEVVAALVRAFRRHHREALAPLLSEDETRPLRAVVTLASIVEREARLDEERRLVAGVYANRLERGIALAADPTIIYALKRRGAWTGNLQRSDLALETPYNTYLHAGLPPGPICSPGLASLRAAADPAPVPYLYFVSRNDGSHVFATTLAEHNRNVERWQRRYWRERRARERAAVEASQAESSPRPETD